MADVEADSGFIHSSRSRVLSTKLEKNFEGYLAMVLLLVYTAIILYDVINRILFGEQLLWGLTTVLGLFSWVCWLSASLAIRSRSHFRFTLFRQRVSNKVNYLLYWVDLLLWIAVFGIVVYFSIDVLMNRMSRGVVITGTDFPRYLMYASVPVGGTLIVLRCIQQIVNVTKKYREGEDIAPDSSI